jgi:hypothetical protein
MANYNGCSNHVTVMVNSKIYKTHHYTFRNCVVQRTIPMGPSRQLGSRPRLYASHCTKGGRKGKELLSVVRMRSVESDTM